MLSLIHAKFHEFLSLIFTDVKRPHTLSLKPLIREGYGSLRISFRRTSTSLIEEVTIIEGSPLVIIRKPKTQHPKGQNPKPKT